jgi:hypothetical protein
MVRYGRGRVRLARKHPETFSWGTLVPVIFVLAAFVGFFGALTSPWIAAAYTAGFGLYVLAVMVTSLSIMLRKKDPALLPWFAMIFPVIHFGAGVGILMEYVWGSARSQRSALAEMRQPAREGAPLGTG